MAISLILLVLILLVLSQFGSKLNAKSSLAWWFIFGFLALSAMSPGLLLPLAKFLGIQLVSNMVMAGLLVLLMFLSIQEGAVTTALQRKLRDSVTTLAAREFSAAHPSPSRDASGGLRVLVVSPAFNEEESLPDFLRSIRGFSPNDGHEYSFVIVNDGSKDRTEEILSAEFSKNHVSHSTNVGVAGVMLTGFKIARRAGFDLVVQCDSDGQHPVTSIPELVDAAVRSGADLVVGSRFLESGRLQRNESTTWLRRLGSTLISGTLRIFFNGTNVTDPTSGFRVYSKSASQDLLRNMPDEYPEPESLALLLMAGRSVQEIEIRMLPRSAGESSLSGLKGVTFMLKVLTALIGLKIRGLFTR
jgi:hypothetical protein